MQQSARITIAGSAAAVLLAAGTAYGITRAPAAAPARVMNAAAQVPAAASLANVTVYACAGTGSSKTFSRVSVTTPPACPPGTYLVEWTGLSNGPSPSPSPTVTSPSPTPTITSPSPTVTSPSPSPTVTSPSPAPTITSPSPAPTATGITCEHVTPDNSNCGPYDYPADTASSGYNTYVGPDVFNPIPGAAWDLKVTDPGSWDMSMTVPDGNTSVVGYPSTGQGSSGDGTNQAISAYSQITSTFAENMHATASTDAEAAYDVWTAAGTENMIQFDFSPLRPGCTAGADPVLATVAFAEPGTGTVQQWDFCEYGSERIWQLHGTGTGNCAQCGSEQSGAVDIKAMLMWEESNGYLAASEQLGLVGFGTEVCSTGGVPEDFQVTGFTLTALPNP